jgi:hypothetical protein
MIRKLMHVEKKRWFSKKIFQILIWLVPSTLDLPDLKYC